MSRNTFVLVVFIAWAALFAASFVYFATTAPTDMGFTRGLNRVTGFLGWQAAALVAAVVALIAGGGVPREARTTRWLARLPMLGQLALACAIGAAIAYGVLNQTSPQEMPPALEPTTPTLG